MKRDCPATDCSTVRQDKEVPSSPRPSAQQPKSLTASFLRPTVQPPNIPTASPIDTSRGLVCRSCGCRHFRVLYTRRAWGGKLLRRRECRHCGRRLTTSETRLG